MSSGVYLTNFSQLAHCLAEFVELACVVACKQQLGRKPPAIYNTLMTHDLLVKIHYAPLSFILSLPKQFYDNPLLSLSFSLSLYRTSNNVRAACISFTLRFNVYNAYGAL